MPEDFCTPLQLFKRLVESSVGFLEVPLHARRECPLGARRVAVQRHPPTRIFPVDAGTQIFPVDTALAVLPREELHLLFCPLVREERECFDSLRLQAQDVCRDLSSTRLL